MRRLAAALPFRELARGEGSGIERVGLPAVVSAQGATPASKLAWNKAAASRRTPKLREFAMRVLPAYDYTCALTHYRMIALSGKTALDAAHIHQFKEGGGNHPTNGIALSKTAHWLFDQGFWSIANDYTILVAEDRFDEKGEAAHLLKPRAGSASMRPANQHYWPDRESLKWHRQWHGFEPP